MSHSLKVVLFGALFFAICAIGAAAENKSGQDTTGTSSGKTETATGCLQKGQESGGYYLTSSDGMVLELSGTTVSLAEHVGHTVAVTGSTIQEPASKEEEISKHEKKEAAGKTHHDFRVADLKMVSQSCK